MYIEVKESVTYNVKLNKEDIIRVKDYLNKHKDDWPSWKLETNVAWAVEQLYNEDEISLFNDDLYERESYVEDIQWSNMEHRSAEEILNSV